MSTSEPGRWYARPVLFVADVDRAADFYVRELGFIEAWRHVDGETPLVAQFDRAGCELIVSTHQPDKVGGGLVFISLGSAVLDALRAELEARDVAVRDGWWGYRLTVVADPDGNELYFPHDEEQR